MEDGCIHILVWRRQNERFSQTTIQENDRLGGGSTMVWGSISFHGKTPLIGQDDCLAFVTDVLDPVVRPFTQQHPEL